MKARDYRARAWGNLTGQWGISVGTWIVASVLGGSLTSGITYSFGSSSEQSEFAPFSFSPEVQSELIGILTVAVVIAVIQLCISGALQLGYCQFLLKQHDRANPEFRDLFSQFHRLWVGLRLVLLETLYIFLWTCLFIVPGFIAAYRYAMAPYILYEHPEMTAREALNASKELMDGKKWNLFCLDCSFIGWNLLSLVTCGISSYFVGPYREAAYAAFYRDISNPQPRITTAQWTPQNDPWQ